mmetsp:Transcript_33740/g.62012  ORF Transcript_33740/g.62012 Transcript_33740/m.62012 type:complete len:206 (-) Transcript_33740:784-1401(-)
MNNGRCRQVVTSGSVYASLANTVFGGASAALLDNLRNDLFDAPFIDRIDLYMIDDIVDVGVGFLSNVLAVRTISLLPSARLLPSSSSSVATVVATASNNIGLPPARTLPSSILTFHNEIHLRPCRVDTTDRTVNPSRPSRFIPDQGTKNSRVYACVRNIMMKVDICCDTNPSTSWCTTSNIPRVLFRSLTARCKVRLALSNCCWS